jgi:hypothetical protein
MSSESPQIFIRDAHGTKAVPRGQPDYAMFRVSVIASSAYISHHIPNPKYDVLDDAASSYITIEGALDTPVIRRQSALVSVHCREKGDPARRSASTTRTGRCWSTSPTRSSRT